MKNIVLLTILKYFCLKNSKKNFNLSNFWLLVMKPFAELSMVKRLLEHSNVQQFRYFKVLIQEFHVKVDLAFTNALMQLFEADEANDAQEVN